MSGNLSGFDANNVEPSEGFTPLPAGEYQIVITGSELKDNKNRNGKVLHLKLQVLNGKFQNRQLLDWINVKNPNETCQQIGQGTLSAICRAVNVLTPNDSSELHNKPLTAVVKIENDDKGNPQNTVKGYKPRHTQAPASEPNDVELAFSESSPATTAPTSPF